ncbi:MAG TPA: hypothetical protein VMB71_02660 [Acetobacteraceae bacterium]|nr:hypothetical protein [Acetobacteraceae bacterium]
MSKGTISTHIKHTVTIGAGYYPDKLTITESGEILPAAHGANGIYVDPGLNGVDITNKGLVFGAAGAASTTGDAGNGGVGIVAASYIGMTNSGTIGGGAGGDSTAKPGNGGNGGAGIMLSIGGAIDNSGLIAGGGGGSSKYSVGGQGGNGVDLSGAATLTNAGSIVGGAGSVGENFFGPGGGAGVDAGPGTRISNYGTISGGENNGYVAAGAVAGGIGVELNNAYLYNKATILGGSGLEQGYSPYGPGGIGVDLLGTSNFVNNGVVAGGNGTYTPIFVNGYGGPGGDGVYLGAGATVTNNGTIAGGNGGSSNYDFGGRGGNGVTIGNGGDVINNGLIEGGQGGGSYYLNPFDVHPGCGVEMKHGGSLTNSGTIIGGGNDYGISGVGVNDVYGGIVTNAGLISGGKGSAGVVLGSHASLMNDATISGGAGQVFGYNLQYGGVGGNGVDIAAGAALSNHGTIAGGAAGYAYYSGGPGAIGVALTTGAGANNYGLISGGRGNGAGSDGGAGVSLLSAASLTNFGMVTGGQGGNGSYPYKDALGDGGAGAYLSGGTLVNAGTISGGAGGSNSYGTGASGDAVLFGTLASTLVVDPGASFNGLVVANEAVNDVLALGGASAATLTGLGTQFLNFTTLEVDTGGIWTLSGDHSFGAGASLVADGALRITGQVIDAGTATIGAKGKLNAAGHGELVVAGVSLQGGTLAGASNATVVVGTLASGGTVGEMTVEAGALISGSGHLNGTSVVDDGTITAAGGTLAIRHAVGGTGTLSIDSGATLFVHEMVDVSSIVFASGGSETLRVGHAAPVLGTVSGFGAGDVFDLRDLHANSLSFHKGLLTLLENGSVVDTLTLAGSYTTANFALSSDNAGGVDVTYVATGEDGRHDIAPPPTETNGPTHGLALAAGWGGWHDMNPAEAPLPLLHHWMT